MMENGNPKIGVAVMAYPGNGLGEEKCNPHVGMVREMLAQKHMDALVYPDLVLTDAQARRAGEMLNAQDIDVLLIVLSTFVPDYFLVELLDKCSLPVFLWSYEWFINSLSIVGGMLITGGLHGIGAKYALGSGDLFDVAVFRKFEAFANAAMLYKRLKDARVGASGGKNHIMLSMTWNEFALKRALGVNVINIPVEELYREAERIDSAAVEASWKETCGAVGRVTVPQRDGLLSSSLYLACLRLAQKYQLDGYSINCFPELKSKICLAVARMNDAGIAAGCEGDLNSTVMMLILNRLSGKAGFNGDFLWMYRESNSILFSHCGAGAFSLAEKREDVVLIPSIETCDGCAVCYPTYARGDYTLLNMMVGENGMRIFALKGQAVKTDLEYSGTPIRVSFERKIDDILSDCVRDGTGHHWSGAPGDHVETIRWLCKFAGIEFRLLS